jgi:hypothetical protein
MESRLHLDKLEEVLEVAGHGCQRMEQVLDETIRTATKELAEKVLE